MSAVRYYADEGLVPPASTIPSGHRLFDVDGIARLELIRTLRDLGAGLDRIRSLLDGAITLGDVLAEHLEIIEVQAQEIQARRAVLRALVTEGSSSARATLLYELATMPDAERRRVVEDFWAEVTADLPGSLRESLDGMRPELPSDPTGKQRCLGEAGRIAAGSVVPWPAGFSPEDPHVVELAARRVDQTAEAAGVPVDDDLRRRLAESCRRFAPLMRDAVEEPECREPFGRYLDLVAAITGTTPPDAELREATAAEPHAQRGTDLQSLGAWLAGAILSRVGGSGRAAHSHLSDSCPNGFRFGCSG